MLVNGHGAGAALTALIMSDMARVCFRVVLNGHGGDSSDINARGSPSMVMVDTALTPVRVEFLLVDAHGTSARECWLVVVETALISVYVGQTVDTALTSVRVDECAYQASRC